MRVSAHVPAVASHSQNAVVRLGMQRDAVQPMWSAATIIVDETSLSGKGEIEVTRRTRHEHQDPPGGGIQQAAKSARSRRLRWRLKCWPGRGAMTWASEAYIEGTARADFHVVISVGRIFKALTLWALTFPSTNTAALRLALGLQTTAIRFARERQLSGFILTGNGNRARLDKLAAEAGVSRVTVLKMTEAQACACRSRRVVSGAERGCGL